MHINAYPTNSSSGTQCSFFSIVDLLSTNKKSPAAIATEPLLVILATLFSVGCNSLKSAHGGFMYNITGSAGDCQTVEIEMAPEGYCRGQSDGESFWRRLSLKRKIPHGDI